MGKTSLGNIDTVCERLGNIVPLLAFFVRQKTINKD